MPKLTGQVNVRLEDSALRDLAAIREVTGEDVSRLFRRLLKEEYGRTVLGLDVPSGAPKCVAEQEREAQLLGRVAAALTGEEAAHTRQEESKP